MTQSEVRKMFIQYKPGVRRAGRKGFWYRCAHCGKWCGRAGGERANIRDDELMEVDHIQSWSHGGSDNMYNLQPLCKPCNRTKSATPTARDNMIILKNNIVHGEVVKTAARKAVRQNKVLKALGLVNRK